MEEMIGCCGHKCNLCLAYRENITSKSDQRRLSEGWSKYFGLDISADEVYCYGCSIQIEGVKRINKVCEVRSCVLDKKLENCASCNQYPCTQISIKILEYKVLDEFSEQIPLEDYQDFIKPYQSKKVLEDLMNNSSCKAEKRMVSGIR
ncbi:uncharacterized protein DUF3795 [Orenia metallireducens]|jgi:hypothetical protein|uniref:DUF3795 domain-containing protein n=1 Tax=Orenia metallireducens TaxID=1413210 RepID=A0A285F3C8_9FIRM|nr:DUF3795 domain-containing protein [Orenia metallireducens]PRX34774.1 uncharacterized protein DUF3795 [Orenia metallireducens]SNY05573.1 Protein of unknown function [Orenia metallireducens]